MIFKKKNIIKLYEVNNLVYKFGEITIVAPIRGYDEVIFF